MGGLTWTRVVFHIETDVSALDMSRLERNGANEERESSVLAQSWLIYLTERQIKGKVQ